jgi:hypothetical protein
VRQTPYRRIFLHLPRPPNAKENSSVLQFNSWFYPLVPDPVEAIKFRLEQEGKDSRALIGVIGQRARV